jgi:iron complex transport system substrate-binding protein
MSSSHRSQMNARNENPSPRRFKSGIGNRHRSIWQGLFYFLISVLIISACGTQNSFDLQSNSSDCKMISHAMGKICVPKHPQRVMVWGGTELDPVLALGITPIAGNPNVLTYIKERLPPEQWQGIENIDSPQGPNLEYILELKPDLILGHESRIKPVYTQLSQIAPTVLDGSEDWKSTFWLFAEALDQTEKARQVMDDYDARISAFKAKMRDRLPFTIASVEVRANSIVLDTKDSFAFAVLREAGLSIAPALSRYTWQNWVLSQEKLDELESDAIFLRTWGGVADERSLAQSELEKLKADPLWKQLKVVQQGQVYQVGDYFQVGGPITANLVLDDLFQYLLPIHS